jgi:hypothetical protein
VRSWQVTHGDDQVTMSRGFHAFFRQYYNLRAVLRRIDPDLQDTYFLGSSEGLLFDVPRDDYDSCLWSPLRRNLERLGAEVRTAEAVAWIDASQELLRIGLGSGAEIAADARVLATDPATLRRLRRLRRPGC